MAEVVLNNINKIYPGGVKAVNDFNLQIKDKEFIVFIGPSGCGKTTTLRMIAGLEEVTGGEIYIGKKLMNDVQPKDRDIAMVFQNYALYPHMTVYDNLAFSLKLRKLPRKKIDSKVKEVAETLGIESLLKRRPKELSGGQRQRVALGRAIVREPFVFLMDEPLSNLDAKLRVQTRTEISKLHERLQTTFIYVTHDQTEAMTMGERIVVMKDGYIQQVDTPQKIYDSPANIFVAGFIGSPQMNFINVRLTKTNDDIYAVFSNNSLLIPKRKYKNVSLEPFIGKEIVMGIRPENIGADQAFISAHQEAVIDTSINVVEILGAETLIYFDINHKQFVARIDPGIPVKEKDNIKVAFDMNYIHLFDTKTENVILN